MCSPYGPSPFSLRGLNSFAVVPSPGLYRLRSGLERFQAIGARSHRVSTALTLSPVLFQPFDFPGPPLQLGARGPLLPAPVVHR
jgi:hypothetical protein